MIVAQFQPAGVRTAQVHQIEVVRLEGRETWEISQSLLADKEQQSLVGRDSDSDIAFGLAEVMVM